MDKKTLVKLAVEARKQAYAPYSHYQVGAALLCEDGSVVTGCNVENASYPAGICAERAAIFAAVSQGKRNFTALAIAGAGEGEEVTAFCSPCGICRQVMAEFAGSDFEIYLAGPKDTYKIYSLEDLLPHAFSL